MKGLIFIAVVACLALPVQAKEKTEKPEYQTVTTKSLNGLHAVAKKVKAIQAVSARPYEIKPVYRRFNESKSKPNQKIDEHQIGEKLPISDELFTTAN